MIPPENRWSAGERYYWFKNNPWTRLPPGPEGCFGCLYWVALIAITLFIFYLGMSLSPI